MTFTAKDWSLVDDLAAVRAENAQLRAALRPFAALANSATFGEYIPGALIKVKDVERAVTALIHEQSTMEPK